jgi:hypothetical protein
MIKYVPVPITEHDALLGKDFSKNFELEMKEYYAPFIKKGRKIQLAKETWEYGVADSIPGADWLGSGNNVVDVKAPALDMDVKGLSCAKLGKESTEASFLQNLAKGADGYSTAWANKDWATLKTIFVDPLEAKHVGTNNLHLLVIVRTKNDLGVHYGLLKAVPNPLDQPKFLAEMKQHAGRSVSIPMIDEEFGRTYICISKRRLEIRIDTEGFGPYLQFSHYSK